MDLDQHNKMILSMMQNREEIVPAGVMCPECRKSGNEVQMVKEADGIMYLSLPAKIKVQCPECDYTDYKIV